MQLVERVSVYAAHAVDAGPVVDEPAKFNQAMVELVRPVTVSFALRHP